MSRHGYISPAGVYKLLPKLVNDISQRRRNGVHGTLGKTRNRVLCDSNGVNDADLTSLFSIRCARSWPARAFKHAR